MRDDGVNIGCLVPMLRCMVTGVIVFVITLGLGYWQGWEEYAAIALMAGAIAALISWLDDGRGWKRLAYGEMEAAQPVVVEAEARTLRLELYKGSQTVYAELPMSFEQAQELARGLLAGTPFSEASWTGAGRPFSKGQFQQMREEFVKRGLARWRNKGAPAQGVELSPEGWDVCRQLTREGGV